MLKGLLNSIKKAKTPQAVRSAASEARQKVLDNSKLTGAKEKDALAEVTSFKNKLIKEMKDASSSTPKAKPSGVAGERAKVRKNEQEAKVTPKKGRIAIWPGSFTHLHRGNPPNKTKYIATGWYAGDGGMNYFKPGQNGKVQGN